MNFITKQVEKKLGVDLNGDGIVGSGHMQSKGHGSSGVGGLLNQAEKVTGVDLNGDGRIGGSSAHGPYQNQYHAHGYPQPSAAGASNNLMNKLEKVSGVDLNGDGRIGGAGHGQAFPRHY